jgi:hypothetical protein
MPLSLYRGDTYRWRFHLWDDAAQTVASDLTGVTATAQIRDRVGGSLITALDCTVTLPNTVDAVLTSANCALLPSTGAWDLQLLYASGDVATVLAGPVSTVADVTQLPTPTPTVFRRHA